MKVIDEWRDNRQKRKQVRIDKLLKLLHELCDDLYELRVKLHTIKRNEKLGILQRKDVVEGKIWLCKQHIKDTFDKLKKEGWNPDDGPSR